jgi:restriction system protein
MECLGPQCAALVLDWLKARAAAGADAGSPDAHATAPRQGLLWTLVPYDDEAPAIRSVNELAGAIEHLQYAVFRRYNNQLTRAERARLDNTIDNALFKIDRYLREGAEPGVERHVDELTGLRQAIRDGRGLAERRLHQARRAELKLAQLDSLTPESFEDFVADLFEMQGYEVERVGGSGDEGADLRLRRNDGLLAVVQCKYHKRSVVGSPVLQRFLGTIHHTRSHKGYFVTTTTFSLSAEKFAANNPIELVDGPRLVELVQDAIGPKSPREVEPSWF